eukprot:TRINITY_DN1275_c0_g1_i3.p1 TRINITY_DN1275_c0_g1~~TRINITY_DN1275_c0_g1_i3.p1  ORF type:complete len:1010 (-),score=329.36 TRINITY_DN1275_c0_g1_i3:98-3097(-)
MSDPLPHSVSYSKSSRSKCKGCSQQITAGHIRFGVTVKSAAFDGTFTIYYHSKCYFKKGKNKGIETTAIEGFKLLKWVDQDALRNKFGEKQVHEAPRTTDFEELVGKLNCNTLTVSEANVLEWAVRDRLSAQCSMAEVKEMLLLNMQSVSGGDDDVVRRCAQGMVFGALEKCPKCKAGNLHFEDHTDTWRCSNFSSSWAKCQYSSVGFSSAQRRTFELNYSSNKFFAQWGVMRGMPKMAPRSNILEGLSVAMAGRIGRTKADLESTLKRHSAKFHTSVVKGGTTHVLSSDNVVYKEENSLLLEAQEAGVPVVYEDFIDECIRERKVVAHQPFVIIKGQSRVMHQQESVEVPQGDSSSEGTNAGPFAASEEGQAEQPRQLKATHFFEDAVPVPDELDLIGFDESDEAFMSDTCHFLEPKMDLGMFNAGLVGASEADGSSLHTSVMLGMVGFEAEAVQEAEEDVDEKMARVRASAAKNAQSKPCWPVMPGTAYSSIAKKYINEDVQEELGSNYHIHEERDENGFVTLFNVMLSRTDITENRNSYYIIQLLAPDRNSKSLPFYVYFKWGRVGTTVGQSKLAKFVVLNSAKKEFEGKFYQKTSNRWQEFCAGRFLKCGGKMFPIELEYEEDSAKGAGSEAAQPSQLPVAVQELVARIFDTKHMKRTMESLKIDTAKMPLGKIKKTMVLEAFRVLKQLEEVIASLSYRDEAQRQQDILALTNQFYTLVPHSFGREDPPLIDNTKLLREKMELIQALGDIEIAANLMDGSGDSPEERTLHPIDRKYRKLRTNIEPVDMGSPLAEVILEYIRNSQSFMFQEKLSVEAIFQVRRQGESEKYSRFDCLSNRRYLWHGSRLSNFAGIISQGLRVAPPEAPHSGFMFGKGIYFADMASKSASYCHPETSDGRILMLLAEVALGETWDLLQGKYVEREDLQMRGKHSTKGVGKYAPAPDKEKYLVPGRSAVCPVGEEVATEFDQAELDHNEYIVYDPEQVLQSFIVQLKVN